MSSSQSFTPSEYLPKRLLRADAEAIDLGDPDFDGIHSRCHSRVSLVALTGMRRLLGNARDRRFGTARLAAVPVGLALLVWVLVFGGPWSALTVYTALVLVTTLPFLPDDMRRKRDRAAG